MQTRIFVIDEGNDKLRIDVYLTKCFSEAASRSQIKRLIQSGAVTINQKLVKPHTVVSCGDKVQVNFIEFPPFFEAIRPEAIPLDIFYEDECLMIINKPCGMSVHPGAGSHSGTLVNALMHHAQHLSDINAPERPGIVHRLDKETSGIIVIAKDNKTHVALARQFENREVQKCYVALVEGLVEFEEGVVDVPLDRDPIHREKRKVSFSDLAREAKTIYRVLKRGNGQTLVSLFPQTGRTHQLRVHMKYLGHPILGDQKYGKKNSFSRLALHAQQTGFHHPANSAWVEFSLRFPSEFIQNI
jgi:23S rRNA pseudouridine1911/1915/1917 synthase